MSRREVSVSEEFKRKVQSVIPVGKENAVTTPYLLDVLDCSRPQLKRAILELRIDSPICSQEGAGGGYWVADCDSDIVEFNNYLKARTETMLETIDKLTQHIGGSR